MSDLTTDFVIPPLRTGGKTLERLVLASRNGVTLNHVAQSARRVGNRIIAVKGVVDFMGTLTGGRSIVFDAKECSRASFDCSTDKVSQHQVDQLIEHGRRGAVAGLMILSTRLDRIYWLDWSQLVRRRPTYRWDALEFVIAANQTIPWPLFGK